MAAVMRSNEGDQRSVSLVKMFVVAWVAFMWLLMASDGAIGTPMLQLGSTRIAYWAQIKPGKIGGSMWVSTTDWWCGVDNRHWNGPAFQVAHCGPFPVEATR